jgi:hypothetical protein
MWTTGQPSTTSNKILFISHEPNVGILWNSCENRRWDYAPCLKWELMASWAISLDNTLIHCHYKETKILGCYAIHMSPTINYSNRINKTAKELLKKKKRNSKYF